MGGFPKTKRHTRRLLKVGDILKVKGQYHKRLPNYVKLIANPDGMYPLVEYIQCSPGNQHMLGKKKAFYRRCLILEEEKLHES
jgi:hypothetical protein